MSEPSDTAGRGGAKRIDRVRLAAPIAVLALGVFFYFIKRIQDFDVWFHLVVGRQVLESGAIPGRHFYIAPLLGEPEQFFEWGFGSLVYLIERAGGEVGLTLANAGLAAAAVLVPPCLAPSRHRGPAFVVGVVAAVTAGALAIDFRALIRPELLLFAAIAVALPLLERLPRGAAWIWPVLAALAWALANLHPSVLVLIAVATLYAAGVAFQHRKACLSGGLGIALMMLAALANPYGAEQIAAPFRMTGDPELMRFVVEFQGIAHTAYFIPYVALAVLTGLAFLAPQGQHRRARLVLCVVFAALAAIYSRNFGLFAIATLLPIRDAISHLVARWTALTGSRLVAMALAMAGVALAAHRAWAGDSGLGLSDQGFPRAAARLAARDDVRAVAVPMHFGGYVAWRSGKSVLADGRNYTFNGALRAHHEVFGRRERWRQTLDAARIDAVFLPALQTHGTPEPLVIGLVTDPEWTLCSLEDGGFWFLRASVAGRPGFDKTLVAHRIAAALRAPGVPAPREADPVYRWVRQAGDPARLRAYRAADACF